MKHPPPFLPFPPATLKPRSPCSLPSHFWPIKIVQNFWTKSELSNSLCPNDLRPYGDAHHCCKPRYKRISTNNFVEQLFGGSERHIKESPSLCSLVGSSKTKTKRVLFGHSPPLSCSIWMERLNRKRHSQFRTPCVVAHAKRRTSLNSLAAFTQSVCGNCESSAH